MREASPPSAVLTAMRTLAIDGITAEAITAFEAAGVSPILLKGPVIARWLYTDGRPRSYRDTDLLIAQDQERSAEETLTALGFRPVAGIGPSPDGIAQHHTWSRGGAVVELHITLVGIRASPTETWACLSADTDTIELRGQRIRTLGLTGRLLHTALHAAQHGRGWPKALTDLERACAAHGVSDWLPVAALARRLLAVEALSAGLDLVPEARALKQHLALPDPSDPKVLLRAESAPPGAMHMAYLAQEAPTDQLRRVVRVMLPTPAFLRWWTPLARRGPLGLPAAYAWRYIHLARTLPAGLASFRRARRSGTPVTTVRLWEAVRTAAWTARALRRTRSALARTGRLTALPGAPKAPSAHPIVLLVLGAGRAKCLSRSAVRQAWLAAQGDPRDLVVGVTAPSTGFRAHAWLDGDPDGAGFTELSRSPAPTASSSPSV